MEASLLISLDSVSIYALHSPNIYLQHSLVLLNLLASLKRNKSNIPLITRQTDRLNHLMKWALAHDSFCHNGLLFKVPQGSLLPLQPHTNMTTALECETIIFQVSRLNYCHSLSCSVPESHTTSALGTEESILEGQGARFPKYIAKDTLCNSNTFRIYVLPVQIEWTALEEFPRYS